MRAVIRQGGMVMFDNHSAAALLPTHVGGLLLRFGDFLIRFRRFEFLEGRMDVMCDLTKEPDVKMIHVGGRAPCKRRNLCSNNL